MNRITSSRQSFRIHFACHSLQKDSLYTLILYRIQSITTTILSVTTPLSRSTGAQERAPMLLPFWSFTSFPMAEQEDCSSSAGSEATVTQSVGDSTMLTISSARLQHVSDMAKVSQSADNLPISHGHDVLMFLFPMIQGRGCRPALSLWPTWTPQNQGKDDSVMEQGHRIWAFLYSLGLVPLICLNWWEKEKRSG